MCGIARKRLEKTPLRRAGHVREIAGTAVYLASAAGAARVVAANTNPYYRVDRISQRVIDLVRVASQVRATTPAGSDFVATLNPDYKWLKTSGLISPDKWGNLPGGEIFTTPGEVNGTFVIDGVEQPLDRLLVRVAAAERPERRLRVRCGCRRLVVPAGGSRHVQRGQPVVVGGRAAGSCGVAAAPSPAMSDTRVVP